MNAKEKITFLIFWFVYGFAIIFFAYNLSASNEGYDEIDSGEFVDESIYVYK